MGTSEEKASAAAPTGAVDTRIQEPYLNQLRKARRNVVVYLLSEVWDAITDAIDWVIDGINDIGDWLDDHCSWFPPQLSNSGVTIVSCKW